MVRQADSLAPPSPAPAKAGPSHRWLRAVATAAALALTGGYVFVHRGQFAVLRNLTAGPILATVVLDALVYAYGAAVIVWAVRVFGVNVGAREGWLLSAFTRFCNLLMPLRGGVLARAVYLNRVHGLAYEHFLAGLSGMLLATMAVSVAWALGGLIVLHVATGHAVGGAVGVLAAALALILLLAILRPKMAEGGGGLRSRLARLLNGWSMLSGNWRVVGVLLLANVLYLMTMAGIFAVLLAGMGRPASWPMLMVIVALGNISSIFQITPGSIGVYEGTVMIVGSLMGIAATDILAATLAWRVLDTLLVVGTGLYASHALTRRGLAGE